jgi:sensor histidine kinase YesM
MIRSAETPGMILKLSGMLRYILYDCNEEKVLLEKEITYIDHYISLQKLKDSEINDIEFDHKEADGKVMIAPMILIPFVENAFKHSKIEDVRKGWIKIKLVSKNQTLEFNIENSIPKVNYTKDETGGIGLENVKRRLDLLYSDRYDLNIEKENGVFKVILRILL